MFIDLAWPQNVSTWMRFRWLLLNLGYEFSDPQGKEIERRKEYEKAERAINRNSRLLGKGSFERERES
eukprot:978143-Amorphochlora_amoeboformis.AAC.1